MAKAKNTFRNLNLLTVRAEFMTWLELNAWLDSWWRFPRSFWVIADLEGSPPGRSSSDVGERLDAKSAIKKLRADPMASILLLNDEYRNPVLDDLAWVTYRANGK